MHLQVLISSSVVPSVPVPIMQQNILPAKLEEECKEMVDTSHSKILRKERKSL